MPIRDGELFERTLDTSVGPIDVLAEVVIDGSTIETPGHRRLSACIEPPGRADV
jgi:hypothetical protein